jgi:hypothetical protein
MFVAPLVLPSGEQLLTLGFVVVTLLCPSDSCPRNSTERMDLTDVRIAEEDAANVLLLTGQILISKLPMSNENMRQHLLTGDLNAA